MSATLISTFTRPLACSGPPTPAIPSDIGTGSPRAGERKQTLRALLVSLHSTSAPTELENCTSTLIRIEEDSSSDTQDKEEEALKNAVTFRLLVNLYAHALDSHLSQAMQAEAEADWWKDIERSRASAFYYLVQSKFILWRVVELVNNVYVPLSTALPLRLSGLVKTVLHALRTQRLPVQFSAFSPTSLRQLFPASSAFQPSALMTALFPHLQHRPLSITASTVLFQQFHIQKPDPNTNTITTMISMISKYMYLVASFMTLPIELARQECEYKRKELERIRDKHAETLGHLAFLRGPLIANVNSQPNNFLSVAELLERTVSGDEATLTKPQDVAVGVSALPYIARLSTFVLSSRNLHEEQLTRLRLRRPSTFVQIWPKLLLLPPLCIYALRYAYASRANIAQVVEDTRETVLGFVRGYLIEPLKDVLYTVRAGGESGVIIRPEAVAADLDVGKPLRLPFSSPINASIVPGAHGTLIGSG